MLGVAPLLPISVECTLFRFDYIVGTGIADTSFLVFGLLAYSSKLYVQINKPHKRKSLVGRINIIIIFDSEHTCYSSSQRL